MSTRWEDLLQKWSDHIQDEAFDGDKIPRACVQSILKHARLTPSSKNFVHYEILRKLGNRILHSHWRNDDTGSDDPELENLVAKLLNGLRSIRRSEYRAYFGCRCSPEKEDGCSCETLAVCDSVGRLRQEIEKMLGIYPKQLQHEHQIKFILALVKSERYTPAEMYAILRVSLCQKF